MTRRKTIALIDGYNAIGRVPAWRELMSTSAHNARQALVRHCLACRQQRRDLAEFCIVFDGDSAVTADGTPSPPGLRIVYTASGETADDRIVAMARAGNADYVVVSEDATVINGSRAVGARHMSPADFHV